MMDLLGAQRLLPIGEGDEVCGQVQTFSKWSHEAFEVRRTLDVCFEHCRVTCQVTHPEVFVVERAITYSSLRLSSSKNQNNIN